MRPPRSIGVRHESIKPSILPDRPRTATSPRRLPPPRGFRATCSCHHPSNILNQSSRAGYTTIQTGLLVFQSLGVWRQVIVCIRGRSRLRPVSVRRPGRLGRGAAARLEACRDYLLLVAEKRLGTDVRAKAGASDLVQDTSSRPGAILASFAETRAVNFAIGCGESSSTTWAASPPSTAIPARETFTAKSVTRAASTGGQHFEVAVSTASPHARMMARAGPGPAPAIEKLPDDYRRAITLRLDQSLTFQQIGQELGRSEEAARKIWVRAMECLRRDWAGTP